MDEITITLGSREFILSEPSIKAGRAWREALNEQLEGVVGIVGALDTETDNTGALKDALPQIKNFLMESIDIVVDLVCAFDKSFEKEREFIEDNATATQVFDALMAMIKVAFPFGAAMDRITRLKNGLQPAQTSTNSVEPSTESGQTS